MIRVGIIGDLQEEGRINQTLHGSKEVEPIGLYNPGRDFKSANFKIYHNPIELLELSDAILIYNSDRITFDFIRLMIRKSKHIYFRRLPVLSISEIADLLKLQKEAGSIIHIYNSLIGTRTGLISEIKPGAKIINLQLSIKNKVKDLSSEIMNALVYLCKIENSPVKHSEVLALKNESNEITMNIHSLCSNGSVHNILLSDRDIHSTIQIFQKNKSITFEFSPTPDTNSNEQITDDLAFLNFIQAINGKSSENISFEDFYNSQKSFLDIREKLNYSGIVI